MHKVMCSYPGRDRPKTSKEVMTSPLLATRSARSVTVTGHDHKHRCIVSQKYDTIKNPHGSMTMSAVYLATFETLH